MKKSISFICAAAALMSFFCANAAEPYQPKTKLRPTCTLRLYPEGQGVDKGIVENGVQVTLGPGESNGISAPEKMHENGNIGLIGDDARIDLYIPKKCKGKMVVVCPGGGYSIVSSFNEGAYVADWFYRQGVAVCVLKYRLPNRHWNVALTDVQKAFRYCRSHAAQRGVEKL